MARATRAAAAVGALLGVGIALFTAVTNGFHTFTDAVRLAAAVSLVFAALAAPVGVVVGLATLASARVRAAAGEIAFAAATVLIAAVWAARRFEFLAAYPERWPFVDGFGGMLAVALVFLGLLAAGTLVAGLGLARLAVRSRPLGVTAPRALAAGGAALLVGAAVIALRPEAGALPGWAATLPEEVSANDHRVLLVGCDGAEWSVIDALIAQGELPTLRSLIAAGVRAPLITIPDRPSPALWTTIASSRPPRLTGISDFYVQHVFGSGTAVAAFPRHFGLNAGLILRDVLGGRAVRVTPVHGDLVRTRRLWEILAEGGVRVGVVNWLVTWPARASGAEFLVSDRTWAARTPDDAGAGPWPVESAGERLWDPPEVGDVLRNEGAAPATEDAFVAASALRLFDVYLPQVTIAYFRDVDAAEHLSWDEWEPRFFRARSAGGSVGPVREAYVAFDRYLGELVDAVGEHATVVVVSDHGHGPWFTWLGRGTPGGHTDAPAGIFLAAGPGIAPAPATSFAPTVYDITPTVLQLVGLPAAVDMQGRVLREILSDDRPLTRVATWENGRGKAVDAPPAEEDEAMMERLRALGYIR